MLEEGLDKGAIWHFGEVAKEQRALAEGKAWADLSHRAVIAISSGKACEYSQSCHCFMRRISRLRMFAPA